MNPPSAVLGEVYGEVWWLIAYYFNCHLQLYTKSHTVDNHTVDNHLRYSKSASVQLPYRYTMKCYTPLNRIIEQLHYCYDYRGMCTDDKCSYIASIMKSICDRIVGYCCIM